MLGAQVPLHGRSPQTTNAVANSQTQAYSLPVAPTTRDPVGEVSTPTRRYWGMMVLSKPPVRRYQ